MSAIPALLVPERKLVPKLWGGVELGQWLGFEAERIGETWEVFDRDGESSRLETPAVAGRTLAELLAEDGPAVLGGASLDPLGRFPLMLKLLDASERLSLQVHPTHEVARELGLAEGGKSEAWVVLRAGPEARLVRGLAPGASCDALFQAIEAGRDPTPLLATLAVDAGDVVDVPAGTLHSVGAGLMLYEIQENSDITLRIHDWGRVDDDGVPRELHVAEGRRAVRPATPADVAVEVEDEGVERLVANDAFTLRRLALGRARDLAVDGVCHLLTVIAGRGVVAAADERVELAPGQTCIVTGQVDSVELRPADWPEGAGVVALLARPATGGI